jgi:hypothetical protein
MPSNENTLGSRSMAVLELWPTAAPKNQVHP